MPTDAFPQAKADKWTGIYLNRETGLELMIRDKKEGYYEGEFRLGQQRFTIQGIPLIGVFTGEYDYQGQKYAFTLSSSGNNWVLTVDGTTVAVEKRSLEAAAVNPPVVDKNEVKQPEPAALNTVTPSSGKRMSDPYAGYSFTVPDGWVCKASSGGYSLTKAGEKAELAVTPHYATSVQQAMAESNQPISDAENQVFLTPVTKSYGNNGIQISINGQAQGKPLSTETISLISRHGNGGVSFSAVSVSGPVVAYLPVLKSMAASVSFSIPKVHPQAAAWKQKLTGKKLLYLKTEGGGSTKITIDLFTDGTYAYAYQSSYSSGGYADFSYADADKDRGEWKIVSRGNEIILLGHSTEKGSYTEFILAPGQNNSEVMLGNRRYFIQSLQ